MWVATSGVKILNGATQEAVSELHNEDPTRGK